MDTRLAQKGNEIKKMASLRQQQNYLMVLHMRESMGLTYEEIGQSFGYTRARAEQVYSEAIKYFREGGENNEEQH